ncbi:MAG: molybdenum cofactor guanylyltransferase [Arachnia sp.]
MTNEPFDAIILAGGGGTRLGGVAKADLSLGGRRLLEVVLDAAASASQRVVVGQVAVPAGVIRTVEDPPGTGPAAGLVAGLKAITGQAPWTLVLACDQPGVADFVPVILAARGPAEGYCADAGHGWQWLSAVYRSDALQAAVAGFGDPRNRSVRSLVSRLRLDRVPVTDAAVRDIDTPDDLAYWKQERP